MLLFDVSATSATSATAAGQPRITKAATGNGCVYWRANDETKGLGIFMPKKFELVPTTAEQSAEHTVPRLLHHPVHHTPH